MALLVLIILAVVVGPMIWRVDPDAQDLAHRIAAPSTAHPLGTDTNGRDVLSRLFHGGRISLLIAFSSVALSSTLGGAIGLVCGFRRGIVDSMLMRTMDVVLSFPPLLLAVAIAAARGPGVGNTVIAVTVPAVPVAARLMRSVVLSVRERPFVFAARASGVRPSRVMTHHVLPNCLTPIIVGATISFGSVLLEVAGLGFLGLGVQPPSAEWGSMLSNARTYIVHRPLVVLAPGLAIMLTALAVHLVGDALRDSLDVTR